MGPLPLDPGTHRQSPCTLGTRGSPAAQQLLWLLPGKETNKQRNLTTLFTFILNIFQFICFEFVLHNLPIVALQRAPRAARLHSVNGHFLLLGSDSEGLRSSSFHCRNNSSWRGTTLTCCAPCAPCPAQFPSVPAVTSHTEHWQGLGDGQCLATKHPKTCPRPCAGSGSVSAAAGWAGAGGAGTKASPEHHQSITRASPEQG